MTIISAVKTYIETYSGITTEIVSVNYLPESPTNYSIVPLPGARIIETDIVGNTVREYPFALQSMESTADELERLENSGFYETFAEWLDTQTEAGTFPTLDAGKTPTKIEATVGGVLFEQGQSDTGVYQIQCLLTYDQTAP
jgi:hypothetical protein